MDQAQFAMALLDAGLPVPKGVTCTRGAADSVRFAVYRNNVAVSLTRALRQRFPVTRRLVGDAFFDGMARAFIAVSLPRDPLIFAYGDGFPGFIAGFPPAASLPYLADTAGLEACWTRAYHAADAVPLAVGALAALPPDEIGRVRLQPHPAVSLACSAFAVGTIWQAHQRPDVGPVALNSGECVLITRPGIDVRVHVIPEPDAVLANALFAGANIEDAARAASAADAGFDVGRALVGLTTLGAFAAATTVGGSE